MKHEYGKQNLNLIVMLNPSDAMWNFFKYILPLLKNEHHLVIPAIPRYDEEEKDRDITGAEEISPETASYLINSGSEKIDLLYGYTMGGATAGKAEYLNAVCDGAITLYELEWIVTRLIAVRNFLGLSVAKLTGEKVVNIPGKAFSTDGYTEDDMKYISSVLRPMSLKTIWRTFLSCGNFSMLFSLPSFGGTFQYRYGEREKKNRAPDTKYVRSYMPQGPACRRKVSETS